MTGSFACSIEVPASAEQVFDYFIDPALLTSWIGDHAVLDARPGGEFLLDIEGIPVRGKYVEVVRPKLVVVTWGHAGSATLPPGSTEVWFTLTPTEAGNTLVEVEHRGLPDEHLASHRVGWPMFLDRLRRTPRSEDRADQPTNKPVTNDDRPMTDRTTLGWSIQ